MIEHEEYEAEPTSQQDRPARLRRYESPRLRELGTVRELTQGGGISAGDFGAFHKVGQ